MARAHATRILQTRQQATFIATLLGSVSLGIAFAATFLVLRVLHTRAQIAQRYVRLQNERNAELEAFAGSPGIPPEAQQQIFEPFRRLNTTRQSGSGLGLATVKKIVEAYHGRLGVWPRHAKGSIFWFELPKSLPVEN